ncbi:acyl-CoA N-acyltransferases (NAT) superfamily protein [Tasmannia lanceolata]|uniref:acyl-CoA N-acyltransferases (NAT) superfamily protein n=1 Tax=Tasmannia lanceolata TaxID=3420 RepID=UPI004064B795
MANPSFIELAKNSTGDGSKTIEEIVKLERKIFPKHESLSASFHEELRKKNCGLIYLEVGGEVAGYVMYSWPSSLYASITKLAVKENYRRQGHGEALLKAAIEKCRTRKICRVCLHVDPSRIPAVSLYQKLGFQIDKLVECYYSSNRNAYRMYLDFDD